jgi:membrane protein DedA with SNARE-associated domain
VLGPILLLLVVGANVGDAVGPDWQRTHPTWLILLNPRNRWLILASPRLDATTFYGFGFFRLVLSDPMFYVLGWFYGDRALRWAERRLGEGALGFTIWEKWFKKAAWPLVAIAPNNIICLVAGAAGMPAAAFVALNAFGTLARLGLIRVLGHTFQDPLDAASTWIHTNRLWLIGVSVAVMALQLATQSRKGGDEVTSLRRELESEGDEPPIAAPDPARAPEIGGDP